MIDSERLGCRGQTNEIFRTMRVDYEGSKKYERMSNKKQTEELRKGNKED